MQKDIFSTKERLSLLLVSNQASDYFASVVVNQLVWSQISGSSLSHRSLSSSTCLSGPCTLFSCGKWINLLA